MLSAPTPQTEHPDVATPMAMELKEPQGLQMELSGLVKNPCAESHTHTPLIKEKVVEQARHVDPSRQERQLLEQDWQTKPTGS
jgi:hypothetical protein